MHLNAKKPEEHWAEIEQLSKAALMDMVWDLSEQMAAAGVGGEPSTERIMQEFRSRRELVEFHRKQAKGGVRS